VRQLGRMPHRHLQNAGADLDALCDGRDDAHQHDRVEGRAAAPKRVGDPQPVEALGLDIARKPGVAVERLARYVGRAAQGIDDMPSHRWVASLLVIVAGAPPSGIAGRCRPRVSASRDAVAPPASVNFPLDKSGLFWYKTGTIESVLLRGLPKPRSAA